MSSDLFVLGMSHRTSPVGLRERLAVEGEALLGRVSELARAAELPEAVLLSTCNRVEVYVSVDDGQGAASRVRRWLEAQAGEPISSFVYERHGAEAVRHAFRVAASLDSMVVGEPQILGQVKDAYQASQAGGTLGSLLDRCFSRAFGVAKRVRSETGIANGSVSVSSVASDLAVKIFGNLEDHRVLLVGAGEMGEAAAKALRGHGADLYVLNRSREKAEALAKATEGRARSLEELEAELGLADVAIASTSAPKFVITPEMVRRVAKQRRGRPLFLIDIAVPRDVDPRVGELDNVFLFDVDDLSKVAEENLAARRKEAERAEAIVHGEVEQFESWRRTTDLKPVIVGLRSHVKTVLHAELGRTAPRLRSLTDKEKRSLDKMVDAMVNKLLHHPVSELKAHAGAARGALLVDALEQLFPLEDDGDAKSPAKSPARSPAKAGETSASPAPGTLEPAAAARAKS